MTAPTIVIPMAGLSRRFSEAGYTLPKYMLDLHGRSVFAHAVGSFAAYFETAPFLFVARDVGATPDFIAAECATLGIANAHVHLLDAPTAGQAETVELGVADLPADAAITVFNIDTFRPGFRYPDFPDSAGYLEVFRGSGANWSYVRPAPGPEPLVLETAEKRPISNLCCTGLYHFAKAGQFRDALAKERVKPSAAELYVAPLFNDLIATGLRVHHQVVDAKDVVFCGVPAEYEALRSATRA